MWHEMNVQCRRIKAETGFWYSTVSLQRVAQKEQYLSTWRKCQPCCCYWVTIMKVQQNQLCITILNKCISFVYVSDTQEKKTAVHQTISKCASWFCFHGLFFPSVPRCAPLGHLLKWLLSSYFLFHFRSLHIINLTAEWKTATDSPVYQLNVAPQSKFFCAWLCEKKSTLAVPDCWLKLLITEQWRSAVLLPRPLTHLIGFQCLKEPIIKDVTVSLPAFTFRFISLYYL